MKKIKTFIAFMTLAFSLSAQDSFVTTSKSEDSLYEVVDIQPQYKEGQNELYKFLAQNVKYPEIARKNGIEGTVYIGFIVEKDGTLTNFRVIRGIGAGCNEDAMLVVKATQGKWKAGSIQGKNVRTKYSIPIKFNLG